MIWLLLLVEVCFFLLAVIITREDLLSPWVITCVMFILSTIFVIPNRETWNVDLSAITILSICLGLLSFGMGEMLVRFIKSNKFKRKYNNFNVNKKFTAIKIKRSVLILFIIFMIVVTYFYYKQVLNLAFAAGYSKDSALPMLRFARIATITDIGDSVSTNKILGQFVIISYSYAYLMLYIILYNWILCKEKKDMLLYLVPVAIYFIQIVLTGGRTGFLYLVGSALIIGCIFNQIKTGWRVKNNAQYIKMGVSVLLLTAIVFFLLGNFTGKTSIFNLFETVSIYFGSSIVGLDKFLESYRVASNEIFGQNTLFGIYDLLKRLGYEIPKLNKAASFVSIGSYNTNIYTSYMRYIKDFSHLGLIIIEFCLGAFFGTLYLKIKKKNKPSLIILIYAIFFQVILESAIEERFFMNILSIGYFVRLSYLILLYVILVKKPWRKNLKNCLN